MNFIQLQMIDGLISSDWWREIIKYFVKENDKFEIRCWKDEDEEIKKALSYGVIFEDNSKNEVSIKGIVTKDLLKELLESPEPKDKNIYNKMTPFFSVRTKNEAYDFSSEHYGTEVYIVNVSDETVENFKKIMLPYWESFSISISD